MTDPHRSSGMGLAVVALGDEVGGADPQPKAIKSKSDSMMSDFLMGDPFRDQFKIKILCFIEKSKGVSMKRYH